jgi:hypothetical protein
MSSLFEKGVMMIRKAFISGLRMDEHGIFLELRCFHVSDIIKLQSLGIGGLTSRE